MVQLIFTVRRVQNLEFDSVPHPCIFFFSVPQQLLWFLLCKEEGALCVNISLPPLSCLTFHRIVYLLPLFMNPFTVFPNSKGGEVEGTVVILVNDS